MAHSRHIDAFIARPHIMLDSTADFSCLLQQHMFETISRHGTNTFATLDEALSSLETTSGRKLVSSRPTTDNLWRFSLFALQTHDQADGLILSRYGSEDPKWNQSGTDGLRLQYRRSISGSIKLEIHNIRMLDE